MFEQCRDVLCQVGEVGGGGEVRRERSDDCGSVVSKEWDEGSCHTCCWGGTL